METYSKLAQARIERGLTQSSVAEAVDVAVTTICRWEKGVIQPYPRHVHKLCHFFGKTAFELGLASSETPAILPVETHLKEDHAFAKLFRRDLELRLTCILYDWLHSKTPSGSYAMLQYRLCQELEDDNSMTNEPKQNHEGVDEARREALRRLALVPIYALGLGVLGTVPSWTHEDILTHCAAGITACEHLSKGIGEDMSLAYGVLTTYLPPLKEIVDQSSQHREEASRLVAQTLLIKATLSLHREGPKRAITYGKQADIYAKESGNIPLQLVILKRLAWMYACDKQQKQALDTILKAQFLLLQQQKTGAPVHAFIQSTIYGGVAKYQARNGQDEEALTAIHDAKQAYFASPSGEDVAGAIDDFNYSTLLLEDGLTYYYLEQYEKALDVFAKAIDLTTLAPKVPASSVRVRIEIINNETLASLKRPQKDLELSIHLWKAGMQGAIDLRSEQRFGEVLTAYDIMQALWPGDPRIKALRAFTRHW